MLTLVTLLLLLSSTNAFQITTYDGNKSSRVGLLQFSDGSCKPATPTSNTKVDYRVMTIGGNQVSFLLPSFDKQKLPRLFSVCNLPDIATFILKVQYPHKVWKHDEFFRAFNTAAYGPKCLPFLRDNSRLSYRKANPKISSC
ncbi:Uncharacterized protein APZ42_008924 [Daphnia magna]|uniref:Uncharacterized protein n=1 Tax=Daphnia magna TaxID=35525 RepID=A0A164EBJ3_9CRUS|nr:Uncharacterized protein APZ42_008924 [Daphnia magna]